MKEHIPRLRMFAGPNGSGKSTLKTVLPFELLGVYLNADEIEASIRSNGYLDLSSYYVETQADVVLAFFHQSTLIQQKELLREVKLLRFIDGRLIFEGIQVNGYYASVAGDFIRQNLLQKAISFTFETVMSHPGKVEVLKHAQSNGYRTYLYYVATDDPTINIARVRYRVNQGGHAVPEDKIIDRYFRSLDLLIDAIEYTNRAYIFDNSGQDRTLLAEITDGRELVMKSNQMPAWFKKAVWDKV